MHEPAPAAGLLDQTAVEVLIADVANHVAELVTVFDPVGTLLWANDGMRRILGWAPDRWVGQHAAELAHPDDIPLGLELLSSAKATGAGVKEPVVYRLRHADGSWVDLECIACVVTLEGQYAVVVTGRPAAQARPATAVFDEASQRVSAMFDRALIGLAQVALDGRILRANDHFASVAGVGSGAELVDHLLYDVFPAETGGDDHNLLDGDGGHHPQICVRQASPTDGSTRATWARVASTLVRDRRGDPLYYAVQAVDVTDLVYARIEVEQVHDEVLRRSQHDDLTGLANRARLAPWLTLAADRSAVLYLDLDGFKLVNDRGGHGAGDAVLVEVAERLRNAVRRQDIAARLGGDEFLVLCPYTTAKQAADLARRLLATLSHPITVANANFDVGASIGVTAARPGDDFATLIERADKALYRAKAEGKRRIHVI